MTEECYKRMIELMRSNFRKETPRVGIFWYNPKDNSLFGVVDIECTSCEYRINGYITIPKTHAEHWNEFDHTGLEDCYRGRVSFNPQTKMALITLGKWIYDYPDVIDVAPQRFFVDNQEKSDYNFHDLTDIYDIPADKIII